MQLRRIFFRCLLILLLVVAQQQAMLHALSHVGEEFSRLAAGQSVADSGQSQAVADVQQHGKQLPAETVCEKCFAYAHADHALPGVAVPVAVSEYRPVAVQLAVLPGSHLTALLAYHSRAPPVIS